MILKDFIASNLGSSQSNSALTLAKRIKRMTEDFSIEEALELLHEKNTWLATNGLEQKSKSEYETLRVGAVNIPSSSKQKVVLSKTLESASSVPSADTQKVVIDKDVNGTSTEKNQKSVQQKSNQQPLADEDGFRIEHFQRVFLVPPAFEVNSLNELDGATICLTKPEDSELVEKLAASLSITLLQKSSSFESFLSGLCDIAIVDANSVTDKDKLITYDVFNHKSEKLYPDGVHPLVRPFVKPNTVPALIFDNDGGTRWEDHKVKVCEYKNGYSYEFGFHPSTSSPARQEWIWR